MRRLGHLLAALFSGTFAVELAASKADNLCIICEFIGFAETEALAQNVLSALNDDGSDGANNDDYCINGRSKNTGTDSVPNYVETIGSTSYTYCVAQFFIYYAKDMKKFVYGVKRYGSTANVNGGLIDLEGYDGIKAYQYSLLYSTTDNEFGLSPKGNGAAGPNPVYKRRNYKYALGARPAETDCTEDDGCDDTVYFMGDGREDDPSTKVLTITPIQETPYTRCLICHGTQEFKTPPAQSSEITDPCWNPSGSTLYKTDLQATLDPRKYCIPPNGFCMTTTWQYSTQDLSGATSSHWVGIERNCPDNTVDAQMATNDNDSGVSHTTKRGATGMKEYVRYYPASNTASKAKDNAKYPDADTAANHPVAIGNVLDTDAYTQISKTAWQALNTEDSTSSGYMGSMSAFITPQFMSPDGSGKPDLPVTVLVPELECLSCVTPIGNTDSTNTCVNAKTAGRVKCKTLSCGSVTSNYLLGDSNDKYYYAKRGCDADPEDGKPDGEQDPADLAVVPAGWTNIKQYNQRTTTKNGNTGRSSSTSTAKIYDCYSCESSFSHVVDGPNPIEPLYDSIKTKDTSLCWETYEPQTDTSVSSTGTSGSCIGNCYTSAYKFKETSGPVTNPTTKFNWYVKRGCAIDKTEVTSGQTPSKDLYGVTVTNSVCTFQNGTLCNGKIEAYDTSLELRTQNVRKLQCYTCSTPSGNVDAADECYTVPSTAKATECEDLSFVSCYAKQTSFLKDGVAQYGMERGCSKEAAASKSEDIEGYTNVKAISTGCSSSSCNKVAGKTDGLVEAVGGGPSTVVDEDAEVSPEVEVDEAEPVEDSASALSLSLLPTLLALLLVRQ